MRCTLLVMGLVLSVLSSCGGEGNIELAASQQLADYQIIDLENGAVTWSAAAPDVAGNRDLVTRSLVLRRMPSQSSVQIGAAADEPFATAAEKPASGSSVRGCFVAVTECTVGQWARLTGTSLPATGAELPVVEVSRDQVLAAFATFAQRTSVVLDLPTHLEWEAAARFGHSGEFPFDPSQPSAREAQVRVRETIASEGVAAVVGSRRANPLGLYDLHGNAWELVRDLDGKGQAGARGGSWSDPVYVARASNRLVVPAEAGHPLIGFRPMLRP